MLTSNGSIDPIHNLRVGPCHTSPSVDHWEMAINEGDNGYTFTGTEEPPADWASISFNEAAWTLAPSPHPNPARDMTQLNGGIYFVVARSAHELIVKKVFKE